VESEDYELKNFGVITAAAKTYPEVAKVPVSQFLGFAVPSDIPAETLQTISTAFETMMDSPSVAEFAKKRNLELLGKHGAEANKIAQAAESAWVWKLQELGLAEKSPESLGIPKPTN
jgi:tripartite-type tricarboxylate transporter receptor subunit TctC